MSRENKTWRKYEREVYRVLEETFKGCSFEFDDYVFGKYSKTDRQIDISIRGEIGGKKIIGIVDCKYFNKNIDVKIIESFLGMIEDVQANFGIIITNKGYSTAAKNRANLKNLRLDIIEFQELKKIELTFDYLVNLKIKEIELSKYEFNKRGKQNSGWFSIEKSNYIKREITFKEGFVDSEYYVYKRTIENAARWFRDFSEIEKLTIRIPFILKDRITLKKVIEKRLYETTFNRKELENYFEVDFYKLKEDIERWRIEILGSKKMKKEYILPFLESKTKFTKYKDYAKIK